MKMKTIVILGAVLGALSILAVWGLNKNWGRNNPSHLGAKLFESLPINEINSIQITSSGGEVQLMKNDDRWVVVNKYSYPADFAKIVELAKKIRDLKIGRQFTASKESIDRQALNDPESAEVQADQKGFRILLDENAGNHLVDLIIGKERDGGGGCYVMRANDSNIYLVDKRFAYFDKQPQDWIEKELIDVKEDDVEQVVAIDETSQSTIFSLKRNASGKEPELIFPQNQLKAGQALDASKVSNLYSLLSPLNIDDVIAPNPALPENNVPMTKRLELHLSNGTRYMLSPGEYKADDASKDDSPTYLLKVQVSYQAPEAQPSDESSAKDDAAQTTDDLQDVATDVKALNKRLAPWTYVIPQWKYSDLIVNLSALRKTEKAD